MVFVIAENQELTAMTGPTPTIYSDPIPLRDHDTATVTFMVHFLWAYGGGGPSGVVAYMAEVSNDGVHWVDAAALADQATAATAEPKLRSADARGTYIRFRMWADVVSGSLVGAAFDLQVKLEHA